MKRTTLKKTTFMLLAVVAAMQPVSSAPAQLAVNMQSSSGSAINKIVNADFRAVTVRRALDDIVRQSGIMLSYSNDVVSSDFLVTARLKDVPAKDAVARVLTGTGIDMRVNDASTITLARGKRIVRAAASGVITGKVVDAKTGKGVSGATVSVGTDGRGTTTDNDGAYRLVNIAAGSHTVTARLVGYAKQTRSVKVGEGTVATADFKLEPSANVLDQVVVTGTVVSTELKAVPNAITVITAKQIEERGITRIDQLFRGDVPGLFAVNVGSNNPRDSVVMFSRGATTFQQVGGPAASNPIKTYVDGVELVNPSYLSQIDPRSIERIEVLTGPQASTIYGSNAINGVMQVFTKRSGSAKPQIVFNGVSGLVQNNINASTTPIHTYDGQINGTEGRFSYNVGGAWDYVGPWTPGKQTQRWGGYGGTRLQGGNKLTVNATLRRSVTANKSTAPGSQWRTERRATGLEAPDPLNNLSSSSTSQLRNQTTGFTIDVAPVSWWSHQLVIGSDEASVDIVATKSSMARPSDTLLLTQFRTTGRTSQRYSSTIQASLSRFVRLSVTTGADHWRARSMVTQASSPSSTGSLTSPTVTRNKPGNNIGGFVQGQLGIQDALFFTYGLRAEWNPNYGEDAQPNLAPRYGVAYTYSVGAVTAKLRGSYGRSTRPPTVDQKSAVAGISTTDIAIAGSFNAVLENPELGPEYQQGGEGGVELYLGSRASLVVTRYNQTVDALIASVPRIDSVRSLLPDAAVCNAGFRAVQPNGYCYVSQSQNINVGSIRNEGWELQGSSGMGPVTLRGTYTWMRSRVLGITPRYRANLTGTQYQPGMAPTYFPEHVWALQTSYVLPASSISLNVNGMTQYFMNQSEFFLVNASARLLNDRARNGFPSGYRSTGKGYAMVDLNASHRFSGILEGILQVQNLTDFYRSDFDASMVAIGRQTKVGLRVRLQ